MIPGENHSLVAFKMKPLFATIAIVMALAGRASGQNALDVSPLSLPANSWFTQLSSHLEEPPLSLINLSDERSDPKFSPNKHLPDSVQAAIFKLVADHASGSTELLRSGGVIELSTRIGNLRSAFDQHTITVRVSYDARPLGGILNIRVQLVPVFDGIGSALRPTISREFAEAVDYFDDDLIAQTIEKLSKEMATELGSSE